VIGVQLEVNIGIIGYKNHAYRLISIVENMVDCNIRFIYHPTKNSTDKRFTKDFEKLLTCDGIIISSPNHTHFEYIKKLTQNYKGYIFCEKPPVTSMKQINFLKNLSNEKKSRIHFNFNYRFSNLSKIIKTNLNSERIGKIIQINIISTHGLAFKKNYEKTWRANGEINKHVVLETVSIHFIDLFTLLFGEIKTIKYIPSLISKKGTSFDTSSLLIEYSNEVQVSIFNSYATPHLEDFLILGTNGIIRIIGNELKIFSPRDTINKKGFFVSPPIYKKQSISMDGDYEDSLIKSLSLFINKIQNQEFFDQKNFDSSILSNKIILKLQNKI
jgi:predicted dehydrogenase